ncbi:MAG: BMP family ABC transporter substrate-binding protein [Eubacterium sp.]|nr:BMP family ABC transporter substrate-binding protein [Eubacterium sp.]
MSFVLYDKAKKMGAKAYKRAVADGRYPFLPVLDDIIDKDSIAKEMNLGLVDIPLSRVVGTSSAGRTQAFASNFMPLMQNGSEFASKWSMLCDAHVDEGIRDAIKVYEYLNFYYVVEGNKRVSVLKFFGADSIPAFVTRKIPKLTDDELVKAYYEYMEFNRKTGVNYIRFTHEGEYKRLMDQVRIAPKHGGEYEEHETVSELINANDTAEGVSSAIRTDFTKIWSDDTLLELKAAYKRFEKAFRIKGGVDLHDVSTGDAFLAFIEVKGFDEVCDMSLGEIQTAIAAMWEEFLVINEKYEVEVSLTPPEEKKNVLSSILSPNYSAAKPLKIAFIYDGDPSESDWRYSHELGRNYIKEVYGEKLVALKITGASTEEEIIKAIDDLVENHGVEVIFTLNAQAVNASLKCAIKYPEVKILNCSLNTSHRYIRTYDARLYEAKFLSGMVAGSLTKTDKVGYIADYPIYGVIANINAFAIGARLVNPNCKVYLQWTSTRKDKNTDVYNSLKEEGVDIIADQDMITPSRASRKFGLYRITSNGPENLTMSVYNWGKLYERIINLVMQGAYSSADADSESKPINYWWGLSAGVVDIILSEKVPADTRRLVKLIKKLIMKDQFSPFWGEIYSQDGKLRTEEGVDMDADDIIKMNWLVDNVVGEIPGIDELDESARELVEMKGV